MQPARRAGIHSRILAFGAGNKVCFPKSPVITFIVNSTGSAGFELELFAKVHFSWRRCRLLWRCFYTGHLAQWPSFPLCGMKTILLLIFHNTLTCVFDFLVEYITHHLVYAGA
jgi:hypothetical protein